ncbi:MAG: hypothetical protein M3Z64_09300 [Verrucomicrobiota bacterium]|nr:hypothetical protein [Verrucomicrobiota bacterium]
MKTLTTLAIASLIAAGCCRAEQINEGNSPSGSLHFSVKGPQDDRRIFLSSADHPQDEVELCQTEGWGNLEVHLSPDDSWVVVQDGGSSLGVSFRLFQRVREVTFKELTDADIDGKAERMALEIHDSAKELLDHRYMRLLSWAADSRSFLFSLSGHGGDEKGHVRIDHWFGIYDLVSGKISFDLRSANHSAVRMETK